MTAPKSHAYDSHGVSATELRERVEMLKRTLEGLSGLTFHDFETLGFGPVEAARITGCKRLWEQHILTIRSALKLVHTWDDMS